MIEERLAQELPVDRLGLEVLRDYRSSSQWSAYNYVNDARNANYSDGALSALSEAIQWLKARGLLAEDLLGQASSAFVTKLGQEVLDEGTEKLYAAELLQTGLHPLVESAARSQFLLGEYELAVFASLKAVEVRVRKLGGYSDDDHGVALINKAFGKGGALRDNDATEGEQEGMRALFAGAYAVFRNPAGHREVDYDNPAEAAEAAQTASLLMRILDRVERRN
jgi:uncharacterized protein (TIGR02391 family)